jgi:hypothetical protein
MNTAKKAKSKFQIDFEYINGDVDGNIWGADISAYSKSQALFLFARRHKNKEYKILQVTDWGVRK